VTVYRDDNQILSADILLSEIGDGKIKIDFNGGCNHDNIDYYADWVFAREYASSEPTTSVGNEN